MVQVGDVTFGGGEVVLMAGPCSVESRDQIREAAGIVAAQGARFLRGGGYKVRTSRSSFQGLGQEGYRLLREAAEGVGLLTVSEVQSPAHIDEVADLVDVLQIGTRNMQTIPLLQAAGQSGKAVLLKRGFGSTIDEWLHAAEYVLAEGNPNVILCERGIRTFEVATRFTLDVAAIALAKARTGLPVVVDPSHAAGARALVQPLALAALAAGADGLLVEVHPHPELALSDGAQSLSPDEFRHLVVAARAVCTAVGRSLSPASE